VKDIDSVKETKKDWIGFSVPRSTTWATSANHQF